MPPLQIIERLSRFLIQPSHPPHFPVKMTEDAEKAGPISQLTADILGLILNSVTNRGDRDSCSKVCKQWLKLIDLIQSSLFVRKPKFPPAILNRFPNLDQFHTNQLTTDSDLEILADTCPKLEDVKVVDFSSREQGFLGSKGMAALGYGCPKLSKVSLIGDKIGNAAVVELVNSSPSLSSLELGHNLIGDPSLRAIACSSITVLKLKNCFHVTDGGLESLARGRTSKTLKKLVIKRCKISDDGVKALKRMRGLEELSLCWCPGDFITDEGGMAISSIRNLKELKLKGLYGVSDVTVSALALCRKLEVIDLSGCEGLTRVGIRAFSKHQGLRRIVLLGLIHIDLSDVESLVLECPSLGVDSIVVDEMWRWDPTWDDELMLEKTRVVLKLCKYNRPYHY